MFLINNIRKILSPIYKDREIKQIFQILNSDKNNNAMLVGGCVRNFLNNEKIGDIDIATIFTPDQLIKKFENSSFKIIQSGIDHGTITLFKDGKNFEITTLREDIRTDGRHAEVVFTKNWEKDSERRDFTINAIYLDQDGKIFDPQNGVQDLKEKKVKFIGNSQKRIEEDYLRVLRFLRFSAYYKFFDKNGDTAKVIKKNLNGIPKLSKERIFTELKKIISLENLKFILSVQELYEIFKIIFPEFKYLSRLKGIEKKAYDKFLRSQPDLILALLMVDETDNHNYFSHKYKVSNYLKDYLNFFHIFLCQIKKNKNFFNKELKKNIFFYGKEKISLSAKFYFMLGTKKNFDNLDYILKKINSTSIPTFPITGNYLLDRGFKSGRKVGEVLKKIEDKWIQNDFNLKDDEINNLIKKHI